MNQKFKVVIPTYNASSYIERCLRSLERQKQRNYEVCIVDDASTEDEQKEIILAYCQRNGWQAVFSEQNEGSIASLIKGIKAVELSEDDIFVQLDGDDWLFGDFVFQQLADSYRSGALVTMGAAVRLHDAFVLPKQFYSKQVINKRLYRQHPYSLELLRSFKGVLWPFICNEDLRDPWGNYYRTGGDCQMWISLCELAGKRLVCLPDILYVYNTLNPIGDLKKDRVAQIAVELKARQTPPYPSLEEILSGKATPFVKWLEAHEASL